MAAGDIIISNSSMAVQAPQLVFHVLSTERPEGGPADELRVGSAQQC